MRVQVDVSGIAPTKIMKNLGVDERGRVQQYLTDRVLFRMKPYMPYFTGAMADLQTHVTSPSTITVGAPYAEYVYNGVSRSGKPLEYTTTVHPKAGAHWDEVMKAEQGAAIAQEVQDYVRSLKK